MRIKLRRPKELFTSLGEAWRSPSPRPTGEAGWGCPLPKTPFSALYLPILAPEFTEQGQEETGKGLKIPYLWREFPPRHPF